MSADLRQAEEQVDTNPVMATEEHVAEHLVETVEYLMAASYEFSELLRRVIPVFRIVPLQAVDSGKPVARAYVTFSFAAIADHRSNGEYVPRPGDFSVAIPPPPVVVTTGLAAMRVLLFQPDNGRVHPLAL